MHVKIDYDESKGKSSTSSFNVFSQTTVMGMHVSLEMQFHWAHHPRRIIPRDHTIEYRRF